MVGLDTERISILFAKRPDIIEGIQYAADTPERIHLFNNIASFVLDECLAFDEPLTKRRRVDPRSDEIGGMLAAPQSAPLIVQQPPVAQVGSEGSLLINMANAAAEEVVLLEIKEISVSIPQRKKYDLVFTKKYLYTKQMGTVAPVQGMVYKWDDIEYVFCTPVPEKQQLSYNFTLFPHKTALASTKLSGPVDFEPLLFTVPSAVPKAGMVGGYAAVTAAQVSDSYSSLVHWAINSQLQSVGNNNVVVVDTDPRVFASSMRQPHRPAEQSVHVKAHRGNKDGFLFFLPNGILWGYKKPLLFIPLERLLSLSYTNVLQRTFNMELEVDVSNMQLGEETGASTETIEFAMIDQEDYQIIDETYVRRFGLQNRSLTEGRRAKRQLRENVLVAKPNAANGVPGPQPVGEAVRGLERAEMILDEEEEEEEEEEEDYDPGSEGDSEGEGETSEEDDELAEEGDDDGEAEGYDEDAVEEEGYAQDHE